MRDTEKQAAEIERTYNFGGQHKTGVKGKNRCKVCGYPFGLGELKKSEDRIEHNCNLIHTVNGTVARESLAMIINGNV